MPGKQIGLCSSIERRINQIPVRQRQISVSSLRHRIESDTSETTFKSTVYKTLDGSPWTPGGCLTDLTGNASDAPKVNSRIMPVIE